MDTKISLVIPVRDEEESVGRLLGSISAQTRLPDEVIFVDAGSSDGTRMAIERCRPRGLKTEVLPIGPAYPGIARNAGVEKAENDLIAFTDAGIELDKDWLKELGAAMERGKGLDVVYGHYMPRVDTLFKECLALAMMQPLTEAGGARMRVRSIASCLIKKAVLRSLGGFPDLRAGEDRVFMEKVDAGNFKIGYSPSAVMTWDIDRKSVV